MYYSGVSGNAGINKSIAAPHHIKVYQYNSDRYIIFYNDNKWLCYWLMQYFRVNFYL